MDCSLPGFPVHGILQARILSGLPCPPPGDDLSDPGIKLMSLAPPTVAGGFFTTEPSVSICLTACVCVFAIVCKRWRVCWEVVYRVWWRIFHFFFMWIYTGFIEFAVNMILPAVCFGFLAIRHVGS